MSQPAHKHMSTRDPDPEQQQEGFRDDRHVLCCTHTSRHTHTQCPAEWHGPLEADGSPLPPPRDHGSVVTVSKAPLSLRVSHHSLLCLTVWGHHWLFKPLDIQLLPSLPPSLSHSLSPVFSLFSLLSPQSVTHAHACTHTHTLPPISMHQSFILPPPL